MAYCLRRQEVRDKYQLLNYFNHNNIKINVFYVMSKIIVAVVVNIHSYMGY